MNTRRGMPSDRRIPPRASRTAEGELSAAIALVRTLDRPSAIAALNSRLTSRGGPTAGTSLSQVVKSKTAYHLEQLLQVVRRNRADREAKNTAHRSLEWIQSHVPWVLSLIPRAVESIRWLVEIDEGKGDGDPHPATGAQVDNPANHTTSPKIR